MSCAAQFELVSNHQGSHSQGNIIFQDISSTKLPFSRTKYASFKGINQDLYEKA
jgi:hypothetical protein